jgi:hypothetical protein
MKNHATETLDDAIDRVAAAMTAVPHDERFAARLAGRLDRPRAFGLSPLMLAGGAVAAVAVALAVGLSVTRPAPVAPAATRDAIAASTSTPAPAARTTAAPPAAAATIDAPVSVSRVARAPRRAPAPVVTRDLERSTPAIPGLAGPAEIAFDRLNLDALAVDPVEVEALDLASLAVAGLDGPFEPKE